MAISSCASLCPPPPPSSPSLSCCSSTNPSHSSQPLIIFLCKTTSYSSSTGKIMLFPCKPISSSSSTRLYPSCTRPSNPLLGLSSSESFKCVPTYVGVYLSCGCRDSVLVRAPDSWSKSREFESQQERRKNFLPQRQLCVLTLRRYPFHPHFTAVARKRPRSFCQKCRWQVTPKHAYTLDSTKSE